MLDKDIMQCKADILRASGSPNRKKQTPDSISEDAPTLKLQPIATNIKEIPPVPKKTSDLVELRPAQSKKKMTLHEETRAAVDDDSENNSPIEIAPTDESEDIVQVMIDEALVNVTLIESPEEDMDCDRPVTIIDLTDNDLAKDNTELDENIEEIFAPDDDQMPSEELLDPEDVNLGTNTEKELTDDLPEISSMELLGQVINQHDSDAEQTTDTRETQTTLSADEPDETKTKIPEFNLADQILTEQRNMVAERRKKPSGTNGQNNKHITPPTGTVGAIIDRSHKSIPNNTPKEKHVVNPRNLTWAVHHLINDEMNMNIQQQRIITDIVRRDIMGLCKTKREGESTWSPYTNN